MKPRRAPRVLVAEPRMTPVESSEATDPTALDSALELLVKWAIRAHERGHPAATKAPTDQNGAAYGPEK
jgi:hypothetical protein